MIETDEQLIHVSRYIHLNPFVAELTQSIEEYRYSSWGEYINKTTKYLCDTKTVINLFSSPEHYKQFVFDQSDYGLTLEKIKHLLHE
ncbi:hypothetical protein HYS97_02405 [Candidatus Daviesbacteria bacterium]|nr:hypothetical protein [Candidatus Daviesbacteria bacterium]